jgi:hypothetical protein
MQILHTDSFPRKTGKCAVHAIPENIVAKIPENEEINEQTLDVALNYLKQINANLVNGDLICFLCFSGYRNDGIAIYDGTNIINLNYDIDDYGCLPKKFQIITDGVPINYWHTIEDINTDMHDYISHNSIVWLDITQTVPNTKINIRDYILMSIQYEQINQRYCIATSFGKYKIIFQYDEDIYDEQINENTSSKIINELTENFRQILENTTDLLILECDSGEYDSIPNCLFLNTTWYRINSM